MTIGSQHIDDMLVLKADHEAGHPNFPTDGCEWCLLPAWLDRRGEPKAKIDIPKRTWVMPDPKRIERIKRADERQRRRAQAALAKDLAGAKRAAETVDQVVGIQRKVR